MISRTISQRSARKGQRFRGVLVTAFTGWLAVTALLYLTQQPASAAELRNGVVIGGRPRVYHLDPRQLLAPAPHKAPFGSGRIVAFEEHAAFTYVLGDASEAYGELVKDNPAESRLSVLRRLLLLKPATLVIEDVIRLPKAGTPVRWWLDVVREPEIVRVQGRLGLVGPKVRFAHAEDVDVTCETLLPEEVLVRSLRPGFNGPFGELDTQHGVDLSPVDDLAEVRFLHVVSVTAKGKDASAAKAEVKFEGGTAELTVRTAGRTFRVWLPPADVNPGHLAVADASGKPLLERRPLPAGVLPYTLDGIRLLERWDSAYRGGGKPAWDTGRPSSDLKAAVEDGTLKPCRVVELGCGTGTNAIYFAQHGFDVTAIDIAPTALAIAAEKAKAAGVKVRWLLADVLAPPKLPPVDLIYDRGCYHGVRRGNAAEYVAAVKQLTKSGSRVLIQAGNANEPPPHYGPPRVKEEEIRADFSDAFEFVRLRETRFDTTDPNRSGAWAWSILLRRR